MHDWKGVCYKEWGVENIRVKVSANRLYWMGERNGMAWNVLRWMSTHKKEIQHENSQRQTI